MPLARVATWVPMGALGAFVRAFYPRVEPELARLGGYVPRGGVAVDAGGWLGPWTQRLTRYADQVVTIEADGGLAAYLKATFPGVTVVHAAASDRAGEITLWVPPGGARPGTSSVTPQRAAASGPLPGTASTQQSGQRVARLPIDDLALTDVRFIKLDVEGHELPALDGAAKTIQRDRPHILLELEERHQPLGPVLDRLASWGYRGFVMPHREWIPLERFDLAGHQRAAIRRVEQSFVRRLVWPYPRYVNTVLFRPAG
jgi:FkbM family methyltransferase